MDTANIMFAEMVDKTYINRVAELAEYDAGHWAGKRRDEVYTPDVVKQIGELGIDFTPPNGESIRMVERRVSMWLEAAFLHRECSYWPAPPDICIVTHGVTIKALLHHVLGMNDRMVWRIRIDNTSVTKLRYTPRGWFVESVNDTGHLLSMA